MAKKQAVVVRDYENAKERDKDISKMAKQGYAVTNMIATGGKVKKGKLLLTGGLGFFTPGGLKRGDRYTVTYQLQQ